MNRAQKNALSALVFLFLTNTIFAYVFFRLFVLKKAPESFTGRFLPLAILILISGTLLVWTLKRQSPREVKADERDKLIDYRAAFAAFISALFVFPIVGVIPRLVLGENGCVPAWLLPLINFGAFIILTMIYFAAILIQYFSGRGDGNK
jgi:hypothetical protein